MSDGVQHLNPYRETALKYYKAGWLGVLPLPHKEKHPPPTGYTGHRAPYPDLDQIKRWSEDGKRHNICVRLAGVDKDYEIIGIDVDHYKKGGKDKKGGDQLKELEAKLGPLPETWISSSRIDGISGIRYFRVPRGLAFRGQVAKDIECISKGYRFAAVWPSLHPEGQTYWWFPPGIVPDEKGRGNWSISSMSLPIAAELPILCEKWLEHITQGLMTADVDDRIDMDSTVDEVYQWAYELFHGDPESDKMCRLYQGKVKIQIKDILENETSHDKIVKAHYNLLRLAAEGHVGWTQAIHDIEQAWVDDVIKRNKRGREELLSEVWRSRTNALRKIKAQIDERIKIGAAPVDANCQLSGGICDCGDDQGQGDGADSSGDDDTDSPDDPLGDVPRGAIVPVGEYRMNDDGNADHFVDMYSNINMGAAVRYADGYGWIIWHEGKKIIGSDGQDRRQPGWVLDREGNQEMRRMWQKVRDRQEDRVENSLKPDYTTKLDQYDTQTPGVSKSDVEHAKRLYLEWKAFAEKSGNNYSAINAIKAVQSKPGVTISVNDLNANPLLLACQNGVLQLTNDDIDIRPAKPDDYITLNTNVVYDKPSDLANNIWNNYLETFFPDLELRNILQIVMGYCIVGGNRQKKIIVLKGGTDTGKSTLLNAIQAALGDYAAPINETVFQSSQFSEVLVSVLDKRVVVCSEFDSSIDLSASVIKRLTGGDNITQAIKYSNETRDADPQFVCLLATNNVPKITGPDQALRNRLLVIPCEEKPQHVNRDQGNIITEVCQMAVLYWLVEGYKQYSVTKQLPTSKLIEDKIDEFMAELDDTAAFIDEAIIKHEKISERIDWKHQLEWCVKRQVVYSHYEMWCIKNKIHDSKMLSSSALTKRFKALGIPGTDGVKTMSINGVSSRYWFGIRLRKVRALRSVTEVPFGPEPKPKNDENVTKSDIGEEK